MKIQNFTLMGVMLGLAVSQGSCARTSFDTSVTLVYGSEVDDGVDVSPAREILEGANGITARVMYRYQGLDLGSWIVEPVGAFPTFIRNSQGAVKLIWHKASGPGLDFLQTSFLRIGSVPYGRRNFQMAVEFIVPIEGPPPDGKVSYFVVAYACFEGPSDRGLSESDFKREMAKGLKVYAGRTCGSCPSAESESLRQDNPDITLSTLSAGTAPTDCN
jgi:hypothetical protein